MSDLQNTPEYITPEGQDVQKIVECLHACATGTYAVCRCCPCCGACLDSGERCDCRDEKKEEATPRGIGNDLWQNTNFILPRGKRKVNV